MPLHDAELELIVNAFAGVLKRELGQRDATIAALEARINALEQRPAVRYCGRWFPDSYYSEGSLITMSGGPWIAERRTMARPGSDDSGWRLIVKSGEAPRS